MATLRTGLIGAHIGRTRLPAALDILCRSAGWSLDFEMVDTAARTGFDLGHAVRAMRDRGRDAVSVTHPHKSDARVLAGNGMSPQQAHLGACNTLIFGDVLRGANTDYTGFLAAWEASGIGACGDVVMMGAGGVAQAIAPALVTRSQTRAVVQIYDPDSEKAAALCKRVGPRARMLTRSELPGAVEQAHGLVNATPLGMAEYPGSAFDARLFRGCQTWAFDAVYTPTNTEFLQAARAAGMICLTGFDLFCAMAVRTFEACTGLAAPVDGHEKLRHLNPNPEFAT